MKVTAVETRPVLVKLENPIGSALGQIHSFGCILVTVRTDAGVNGENLIFTLNGKRTKVLRQMVDELADLIIGRILAAGDWDAVRWLLRRLPKPALGDWLERRGGAGLDVRRLRFWEIVLGLPRRQVDAWLTNRPRGASGAHTW